MKKLIPTLLLVAVLAAACSKYEEGPAISLLPKKTRLVNTWKIDKYVDADGDVEEEDNGDTFDIKDDNTITISSEFGGSTVSFNGTWEFTNDKQDLTTTVEYFGVEDTQVYTIIKLKNDELWLEDEDGDQTHFVPAD